MAYYHRHIQQLAKDYPPFEYPDEEVEVAKPPAAAAAAATSGMTQW
eukprot:CAMPEP_0197596972 /NCGR_PEP_ID=MMETSP1326-20131121/26282_1 /TAXON_ID=1155430 /ORGANISM="Genus nov. species nov., Strain RCC2288" /LENGTH=45 /DNA_ID= /DNA_START= /DNA_END= /DNA_ORIENTATION=